jgi:hypothetical protein
VEGGDRQVYAGSPASHKSPLPPDTPIGRATGRPHLLALAAFILSSAAAAVAATASTFARCEGPLRLRGGSWSGRRFHGTFGGKAPASRPAAAAPPEADGAPGLAAEQETPVPPLCDGSGTSGTAKPCAEAGGSKVASGAREQAAAGAGAHAVYGAVQMGVKRQDSDSSLQGTPAIWEHNDPRWPDIKDRGQSAAVDAPSHASAPAAISGGRLPIGGQHDHRTEFNEFSYTGHTDPVARHRESEAVEQRKRRDSENELRRAMSSDFGTTLSPAAGGGIRRHSLACSLCCPRLVAAFVSASYLPSSEPLSH